MSKTIDKYYLLFYVTQCIVIGKDFILIVRVKQPTGSISYST